MKVDRPPGGPGTKGESPRSQYQRGILQGVESGESRMINCAIGKQVLVGKKHIRVDAHPKEQQNNEVRAGAGWLLIGWVHLGFDCDRGQQRYEVEKQGGIGKGAVSNGAGAQSKP